MRKVYFTATLKCSVEVHEGESVHQVIEETMCEFENSDPLYCEILDSEYEITDAK